MTTTLSAPTTNPGAAPVEDEPHGGTRWRRVGILFIPALVAMLGLAFAVLHGHIPLRLAVSGQDFKLTSNGAAVRTPSGLTLYPAKLTMKDGSTRYVAIAGIDAADLPKGLCISLTLTFPVAGTFTVQLHTSGDTKANGMVLDASSLRSGRTTLLPRTSDGKPGNTRNLQVPATIGKDSGDLPGAPSGRFGIEAPGSGSLDDLRASAQGAIISGTATLNGLSVDLSHGRGTGNGECF